MDTHHVKPLAAASRVPELAYASTRIGELLMPDRSRYVVHAGLDEHMVHQLRGYALDDADTELATHTADRARFGEGSYEAWFAKGRYPYALLDATGVLAALIWFGPEPLPEDAGYIPRYPLDAWDNPRAALVSGLPRAQAHDAVRAFRHRPACGAFPGPQALARDGCGQRGGHRALYKLGFVERGYRQSNGRRIMTRE